MKEIVSTIDITLKIPKNFRGVFPNSSQLTIAFTANTPKSVPDYVAEWYTEMKPHIFSYTTAGMNNNFGSDVVTVNSSTPTRVPVHAFANWVQFMQEDETATAIVYAGGKDVSAANGWAALQKYDTSEKYYENLKDMWLISDIDDVTVKILWGSDAK